MRDTRRFDKEISRKTYDMNSQSQELQPQFNERNRKEDNPVHDFNRSRALTGRMDALTLTRLRSTVAYSSSL